MKQELTRTENGNIALVNDMSRQGASLMAGMDIPLTFRPHVSVSIETAKHGIKYLIESILVRNDCVMPEWDGNGHEREKYFAHSMTSEDIISAVRREFGFDRYPDASIHTFLSVFMVRRGMVGKFRMTKEEDSNRACKVPRCRFYLIAKE